MQAFGQSGIGVFIAPSVIAQEVMRQFDVELIGHTEAVTESFAPLPWSARSATPASLQLPRGHAASCLHPALAHWQRLGGHQHQRQRRSIPG